MKRIILTFALFFVAFSIKSQTVNTLTPAEKKSGWKLLFDGKSFAGWHNYRKKGIGERWVISQGAMKLNVGAEEGGDIVTNEVFKGDFEFKIDWKIVPYANNGVFFFVNESPAFKTMYESGLELQVIDNAIYKNEKKDNKHLVGDFFGILKARNAQAKKPGEWNRYHVIFKKNVLRVSLNGSLIHNIDVNGSEWKTAVSQSFLKNSPFAKGRFEGRIGLQDWHSEVWYRNIKARKF